MLQRQHTQERSFLSSLFPVQHSLSQRMGSPFILLFKTEILQSFNFFLSFSLYLNTQSCIKLILNGLGHQFLKLLIAIFNISISFSSDQFSSLSHVPLFATPRTAAHHTSLSIANSWSLLKLMSIKLLMPFNHLSLCLPLLLLPSIFHSIRSFPMIQFFTSVAKALEFQLQHQSF